MSDWSHGWDKTPYLLKKGVVKQIEARLHDFLSVRRVEPTYIERMHGAPSWMIRVEGVVHDDTFHVFEVEDRPAGIGMLKKYVDPEGLRLHFQEWKDVVVVDSGSRNGIDDHHWGARIVSLDEARISRSLVLVRARPEEERFHSLVDQAVAPVAYEGDKRYGERLGWWYRVSRTSENLLKKIDLYNLFSYLMRQSHFVLLVQHTVMNPQVYMLYKRYLNTLESRSGF